MDRALIEGLFATFMAKDLDKVMAIFAEDAYLYDPHYPIPDMKGKPAIRRGLEWGLGGMEKPGFAIRNCWIDGDKAVVELDTHHVFKGGMQVRFPQVFVIEMRAGLVTRLQSYVPYPPHGIARWMGRIAWLQWKLQGKI